MKKTNKIFVLTLLLTVAAFVARADGFKPSGTTTSGGITNGDLRAVTLTNAANVFAGSFSGNLNGEFGAGINPYLFTNGLAVDCVNSDGLGGDNIFTVSANLENIYDGGLGLSSGENFFWTNSSSLTYQIYSNSVASPVWSTWQVIYPAITETPLGSSGKSRYGFNATASVNAFYYVQRTSGAPSFSGAISGGAKGKTFSLGFDTNGGFSDLNLNFSGVPILKLEGASGVLDLNDSTGNNIASGSTKFGFAFGNGAGGTSASVDTNGIFYGKNFVGSGAGLTNLTSATVQTNASIVRTNDTTWFDAKGAATAATNVLGANAYTSGNAAGFTNDVRAVVTNTPGNITTNGATALGQVPYFTNTLNGWGWYIPGAGTGGNVFSNTQSFFQSLIITNTLQVSNITPTQVLIGTNSISIGTNLTASSYILDVNSGSALGAAGAGLVARFTAGASSDLIISNDTSIARLYLGHAGLSGGAAAFVVEKLSSAADGYWGENADAGGYFFRGQGAFSFGGSTPAINIPSAGSGGGNIVCTTNISLLGSEQISGTLKITNAVSVLANGSVSALYVASTNFLLMQTNYNNANWAPIPGQMKIICSNNWMFGVSDHSTNALFLIQP